jgi:hypothetical protein
MPRWVLTHVGRSLRGHASAHPRRVQYPWSIAMVAVELLSVVGLYVVIAFGLSWWLVRHRSSIEG